MTSWHYTSEYRRQLRRQSRWFVLAELTKLLSAMALSALAVVVVAAILVYL